MTVMVRGATVVQPLALLLLCGRCDGGAPQALGVDEPKGGGRNLTPGASPFEAALGAAAASLGEGAALSPAALVRAQHLAHGQRGHVLRAVEVHEVELGELVNDGLKGPPHSVAAAQPGRHVRAAIPRVNQVLRVHVPRHHAGIVRLPAHHGRVHARQPRHLGQAANVHLDGVH
jgi:hypothetical protein